MAPSLFRGTGAGSTRTDVGERAPLRPLPAPRRPGGRWDRRLFATGRQQAFTAEERRHEPLPLPSARPLALGALRTPTDHAPAAGRAGKHAVFYHPAPGVVDGSGMAERPPDPPRGRNEALQRAEYHRAARVTWTERLNLN